MEKDIKKLPILIISLCISINLLSVNAFASSSFSESFIPNAQAMEITQAEQQITPLSDIIGWRYKTEGSKMYRRQYNYSKQEWIGEWELC